MKKRIRIVALAAAMCMLFGSMTVFAETKTFTFKIKAEEYDEGVWLARKADSEQTAYITPTSITGAGRIWVAVYDERGGTQYTYDVAIQPGETYRHTTGYYKKGVAGNTYRIIGGDPEWEVTSGTFNVTGRWTP
ncbi:MAG: hypothetical protein HDR71_10560 [Lachnospiraceae bacterium]|nr:hypothetical protein [Lachnospiraceae bacterium]